MLRTTPPRQRSRLRPAFVFSVVAVIKWFVINDLVDACGSLSMSAGKAVAGA